MIEFRQTEVIARVANPAALADEEGVPARAHVSRGREFDGDETRAPLDDSSIVSSSYYRQIDASHRWRGRDFLFVKLADGRRNRLQQSLAANDGFEFQFRRYHSELIALLSNTSAEAPPCARC